MAEYRGLPSELIDRIFDALWKSSIPWYITNDQRALVKNCLPVSTDFRHHILSRFCKYVKFSNDDARRVFRLRELISQPQNSRLGGIGRFIKHFSLNFQLLNQKRDVSELRIIRQIVQDSDLAAIVKGLHGDDFGVAEFSLTVECIDADGAFWTDLPAMFRAAFQSLLHSPFLIQLSLKNLVVPESFFSGSFLQDLSIEQVPILFSADPPRNTKLDLVPVSSSLFPSLVTLRTDYSHEIYPSPPGVYVG
ncbi:hypothetical protein M413DRAFT_145279 [Hebeloma cylindrosporum]|uniref:Uncharacterized protein n=1 Tax=Hebeloma cylindrosporum TaxID=76867 RepID=A0A0C2XUD7_HEBCY|nr:hypothetical protein M413DRAFT_145279 [Hebeloma cylindrosporum h7]